MTIDHKIIHMAFNCGFDRVCFHLVQLNRINGKIIINVIIVIITIFITFILFHHQLRSSIYSRTKNIDRLCISLCTRSVCSIGFVLIFLLPTRSHFRKN